MEEMKVFYHKDGSIHARGPIVNGEPEGYWEWFRKEGTIKRSGYFKKGKQVGIWKTFDAKGNLVKETTMHSESYIVQCDP